MALKIKTILAKVRFSSRRKGPYLFWRKILGFTPKNLGIYELALTHKSVTKGGNERLEFLGDSVIDLVLAQQLYLLYPNEREGNLTRMRAKIVCRENLNSIAHDMGLGNYLKIGHGLKSNAEDIYGNALEALIGAIYLDKGFACAEAFINRYIVGHNQKHLRKLVEKEVDFKSRLLEWGQARKKTIDFQCLKDHYKIENDTHSFIYAVVINGKEVAQAAGSSKLEAQQRAAKKALQDMK